MNDETNSAISIPQVAKQLGLDSFTLYGLIRCEKVRPQHARRGELLIPESEIDRVLKGSNSVLGGQSEGGQLC